MVGLVIVSHSWQLAQSVAVLARQVVGPDVRIETAGGLADGDDRPGTDPIRVLTAIQRVDAGAGVLVLMDLGSAVQSAEQAVAMLGPEAAALIRLCDAPLVEGAVAAAVAAGIDASLDEVEAEARRGGAAKTAHLGGTPSASVATQPAEATDEWAEVVITITAAMGLHARPAARFVQTAAEFEAEILAENVTTGAGPARARSLTDITTLGASQGHQVRVRARGVQAPDALAALAALAARGFDDAQIEPAPPAAVTRPLVHDLAGSERGAIRGLAAAPGAAIGPARRLRRGPPRRREHGTPDAEREALHVALDRARADLQVLRDTLARQAGEGHATMLDAQLALLGDEALVDPALVAIAQGERAEIAWDQAVARASQRFAALEDSYLRARADDVREVGRRILDHLMGQGATTVLRGPGILIAPELGPAQLAALDMSMVQGIVVATGSPLSHAAILARALGVPAVVGVGEMVLTIAEEMTLLVDGDAGTITIDPDLATIARIEHQAAEQTAAWERDAHDALGSAVTTDGVTIEVAVNVSSGGEVGAAITRGADGVGLFRTEVLFMNRDSPPDEQEQYQVYSTAAEAAAGRMLIVRTLDAGGDKPIDYLSGAVEANPFLGTRGIRLSLDQPDLFAAQLRAVLRAAADHDNVAVMFPMVATLGELRRAQAALDAARAELVARGLVAGTPQVGVMIEVPSAALLADQLASEVDFFSIGTNDLTQYVMAAERGNTTLVDLVDSAHPAVVRLIAHVCGSAAEHGRWVGVCGEAAADPVTAALFVGLGVRELSVAAPAVGQIKALVRSLDTAVLADVAAQAVACSDAAQVRALVVAQLDLG
jgi:multiphosphoryl transfer protein